MENIMTTQKNNFGLGRKLLMWLASYVVIGFCAAYYFNAPLTMLIPVGVATLVVTLARHALIKK